MTCTKRGHSIWTTCTCPPCQTARRRQAKIARTGRYHRVPSDVALAHVLDWTEAGYSPAWIATAAGLAKSYVQAIVSGNRCGRARGIGPVYAARIVATDLTAATAGVGPALGSRRRLQALAVLGWTVEELGDRSGVKFTTIAAIQRGATQQITAARAATVHALWTDLAETRGPSTEATRRALAKGWAPPAAWDDIDDPNATPDGVPCSHRGCTHAPEVAGLCRRHYSDRREGRERQRVVINVDDLEDLSRWGLTVPQAAERLGISRDGVENALRKEDGPLKARYARNAIATEVAA